MKLTPALSLVLLAAPSIARADASVATTGRGQQSLALRVTPAGIVARVCPSGACSADGGVSLDVASDARPNLGRATARAIDVGSGRNVVRVDVPGADKEVWTMLVAAPLTGPSGAPVTLWSGWTGRNKGEEGETRSSVVRDEVDDKTHAHEIMVGELREDVGICGRPTVVAAKRIDPATMALATTSVQSLSASDRDKAVKITAAKSAGSQQPIARLLRATSASSAVDRKIATATDGDPETVWSERSPGAGAGEFLSLSSSADVPITSVELRFRPANASVDEGAAPKTFFIATHDQLFKIAMPEDAWKSPGASFEVKLPEALKTDCMALVLDQAYSSSKDAKVTIAEVTAHTAFDSASLDALVTALDGKDGPAAAALLARSGAAGVKSVAAGYAKLGEAAKLLSLGVVDSGTCGDQVPFFIARFEEALATKGKAAPREEDPTLVHARDRLRRCPNDAAPAFTRLLSEGNEKVQAVAAAELSMLKPAAAVPALLDALPKANDATRAELRAALAHAAGSERAMGALRNEVDPSKFSARSDLVKIDLLRALGPSLGKVEGSSAALFSLATPAADFRTRFLLQIPAAELARAGDAKAEAFVRDSLHKDADAHVRARAAEAAGRVPSLANDLVAAVDDAEVRVREAAINALADGDVAGKATGASAALAKRLANDDWTFVRAGSARALAKLPADAVADKALAGAMSDRSADVRGKAIDALGAHKSKAYASDVRARAEDTEENPEVRARAILALASMCDSGSLAAWTKLALAARQPSDDVERRLSAAAVAALGILHPADLEARLAPLLAKDTPIGPREAAKAALSEPGKCGK